MFAEKRMKTNGLVLSSSARLSPCDKAIGSLIPNLPNELALLCLVRVPSVYHHVLRNVSKPIRYAVSSPEFYQTRSHLCLAENVLYACVRSPFQVTAAWFSFHGDVRVPVPPVPVDRLDHSFSAAAGGKIYVLGGRTFGPGAHAGGSASSDVWILDCRSDKWSRGPNMTVARLYPMAAALGGRIYAVGATSGRLPFAEVLDPSTGFWEALPEPPGKSTLGMNCVQADGGLIRVILEHSELWFDPATWAWGELMIPVNRRLINPCYFGGELFSFDVTRWLVTKWSGEEWKEVEGLEGALPQGFYAGPRLYNLEGKLVAMVGRGSGLDYGIRGKRRLPEKEKNMPFEVWCAEIVVDGFTGRVPRSFKIFSQLPTPIPPHLPIYGDNVYTGDWALFSMLL